METYSSYGHFFRNFFILTDGQTNTHIIYIYIYNIMCFKCMEITEKLVWTRLKLLKNIFIKTYHYK